METLQKVRKAWEVLQKKDKELRGSNNGPICGYRKWLKAHVQGLDWLPSLRTAKREEVEAPKEDEEENAELRDVNVATTKALEQETKRARREEHGRNKFRGALLGSNRELKLRREERDQSQVDSLILKDELKACSRSKRSLSQCLCKTETNMLAIISKYQEELSLATTHEHRVADEYAQVYVEKEARGRVIDSLHQEATMWMDRFALTLNGSQELPRLLAKAKAMEDTYSAPEEIHGLLGYWKNTITKRAIRHPYRTRCKSRTMGDQEETHEQMKADMSALKEQMASMMEAMLGMRQLMERNVATAAAVSSTAEADPTLLATAHHPPPNMVGRGRSTLGHNSNPHLGYNRVAYPYGLPPNYTPPVMQDDAGHVSSPILEGEPPRQPDEVHEDHQEYAKGETFKEYAQRWRDLAAQVALPMVEREMITMMVDTLPVFYYEKLVGYMPSNFADLVFAREKIEVGLKRGKFDYVSSTSTHAKRVAATGAKRKEGDTHAVTLVPTWVKPPQTSHGIHQYAQHHLSFSARAGNSSNSAPVQPKAPIQREAPQAPAPTTTRPAVNSNAMRNFPPKPIPEFTPLPMTYEDLLPSLIANQMTVQHLIDAGWLTFQEDRPNVKTNTLANHGGGAVNAIESDGPRRSKPLKDVATPRRFIYEALQKGGVIPHSGHEEDSCLLHASELHNMETCLEVEDLLKRMIDQGRLEVGNEGREEQHISVPFPYQNSHAIPWRYTPPSEREEEATDVSSLSAKVTNITGLSGVTRSGRVFAPSDQPTQPANIKTKMVEEQNDKTTLTPNEDILVKGLPEKMDGCGKKEVSLEEASEFLRIIQQSEFKVIEQLNKTPAKVSLLELLMSSEPHRALLEMARKKLFAKRSRRNAMAEGTSAAPELDSHRFRSAEHQQRYEAIKGWSFHRERRVQLRDDEYTDFQEEIAHRRWTSLVTPMAKFDPDIVLEFYANAWPIKEGVQDMRSWVRGQWIPFDADALSQFLGDLLVLEEGQECEFS
ncbi:hypothetical protein GmHk_07G019697 [Glycine max]|nr:hypothetical protein GmHk_07G019697 [Glycine max]